MTVTANFSEAMQQTPTISLGSVFVDAQMSPTASPKEWTYFIDFGTLTITPGNYAITVGGRDLSGNIYSSSGGLLDGSETSTDTILIDYQKLTTSITVSDVTRTFNDPDFGLTATSSSTGNFRFDIVGSCSAVTISGLSSVTINGAGTCRVRVKQDETLSYQTPPEVFFDIIINKATPSINPPDLTRTCGISEFPLTANCPSVPKQIDLVGLYDFNGDLNDFSKILLSPKSATSLFMLIIDSAKVDPLLGIPTIKILRGYCLSS